MISFTDSTSGVQTLAADNAANVELGSATPSAPLSVDGRATLDGAVLAQQVVAPAGMARITASVAVPSGGSTDVACPACSGIGSADNYCTIWQFNADKTSFSIMTNYTSGTPTTNYSVF